jgi:putative phage-type endonuclease
MKTHDLIQGSPEWLAYRANHFNASDAPAMMGCSAYKSRSALLHELATGHAAEVDSGTQRRFDEGHRIEALARPLAEKIIGEDLYPVVGSEGKYSASFDGLTMAEDTGFEHKTLNDELRAAMRDEGNGWDLPMQYQVQMEQQLMVSGAERILFMATKWDGDNLIEQRKCWYASDPQLRAKIIAGWKQFAQDLAAYVPPEVIVPAVAKAVSSLPVVFDMRVQGQLVSCNLEEYKPAALAYIEKINTKLVNDQDFVDADADAKFCRDSADKLELAIEQSLGQMGDINQALNTVREIAAAFDAKGLALEKLVKAEKENRRNAIVSEAAAAFVLHIKGLNERLGQQYMPAIATDFPGVVKGLKSIDSMRDKVATELARAKIAANEMADRIQANMQKLVAVGEKLTFPDAASLVLKAPDDLAAVIALRVAEADRKAEELRESIRKEEAEKLAVAPVESAQAATENVAPTVTHGDVVRVMMPATVRQAMAPKPAAKPETPPTLTLGEISTRLGFNCTSAFLATLGFEAATVKAAKLYHSDDFTAICEAIKTHITEVQDQFEPVAA